jgi:hypothetical protein
VQEQKAPVIIKAWNLTREDPDIKLDNVQKILWRGRQGQKYPEIL